MDFLDLYKRYQRKLENLNNNIEEFKSSNKYIDFNIAVSNIKKEKEEVSLLLKAIEKQICRRRLFDNVDTYLCPNCNEEVEDNEYCSNCGQRLEL